MYIPISILKVTNVLPIIFDYVVAYFIIFVFGKFNFCKLKFKHRRAKVTVRIRSCQPIRLLLRRRMNGKIRILCREFLFRRRAVLDFALLVSLVFSKRGKNAKKCKNKKPKINQKHGRNGCR